MCSEAFSIFSARNLMFSRALAAYSATGRNMALHHPRLKKQLILRKKGL
jgi:hypothetical protein